MNNFSQIIIIPFLPIYDNNPLTIKKNLVFLIYYIAFESTILQMCSKEIF